MGPPTLLTTDQQAASHAAAQPAWRDADGKQ
jgi:hypothetical protein